MRAFHGGDDGQCHAALHHAILVYIGATRHLCLVLKISWCNVVFDGIAELSLKRNSLSNWCRAIEQILSHIDPLHKQCITNSLEQIERGHMGEWLLSQTQNCSPTCNAPFQICIIYGSLSASARWPKIYTDEIQV